MNKDRTPKISPEYPVTNTPRSSLVRGCYKKLLITVERRSQVYSVLLLQINSLKGVTYAKTLYAVSGRRKHRKSNTSGIFAWRRKDGISKTSNISKERIIKEVKLRLRRYKPVQSRKVQIPKENGEYRELTIINLFDRIAQQAVCQVISPLLEEQMSKHSYGFRKGIGAKIPVSKLAATLNKSKDIYTIELDFKKCFDNIPLDKAIGCVKSLPAQRDSFLGV